MVGQPVVQAPVKIDQPSRLPHGFKAPPSLQDQDRQLASHDGLLKRRPDSLNSQFDAKWCKVLVGVSVACTGVSTCSTVRSYSTIRFQPRLGQGCQGSSSFLSSFLKVPYLTARTEEWTSTNMLHGAVQTCPNVSKRRSSTHMTCRTNSPPRKKPAWRKSSHLGRL